MHMNFNEKINEITSFQIHLTNEKIDKLIETSPPFILKFKRFCQNTVEINKRKRLNNSTISKIEHLQTFLELPSLMQTSSKRNQYTIALELHHYIKHIKEKHININIIKVSSKIVCSIVILMKQDFSFLNAFASQK